MANFRTITLSVLVFLLASFNGIEGQNSVDKDVDSNLKCVAKLVENNLIPNDDFENFVTSLEESLTRTKTIASKIEDYNLSTRNDHVVLTIYTLNNVSKIKLLVKEKNVFVPEVITLCSSNKDIDGNYPGDCVCNEVIDCTKTCLRGLVF